MTQDQAGSVEVSVIIACRNAKPTIGRCLESLRRQRTKLPYEVIVADSSTDGTDELIAARYPEVRLLHSELRMWPGDARNMALKEARGETVLFIDADCEASPDWIESAAGALEGWRGTVGGEIAQAEPAGVTEWAAYFCEFSHWMPGTLEGEVFEVPTCNMGVRMDVLREAGPFLEGVYCSDSELHWRLKRMGRRTRFAPAMRVAHMTEGGWGTLFGHEFFHGRSYGRMRRRHGGMGKCRLWMMRTLGAALSMVVAAKTAARVWRRGRYRGPLLKCLPLLMLASAAWGVGELAGYWSEEAE